MKIYIDLVKGYLDTAKLVKKMVMVKKSNGTTFQRMQWVRPDGTPVVPEKPRKPVSKAVRKKFTEEYEGDSDWFKQDQVDGNGDGNSYYDKLNSKELFDKFKEGKYDKKPNPLNLPHNLHAVLHMANLASSHNSANTHLENAFYGFLHNYYDNDSHEDLNTKMDIFRENCHNAAITINFDPFGGEHGEATYNGMLSSGKFLPNTLGGHEGSGEDYKYDRESIEHHLFNIKPGEPNEHRPIYGALNITDNPMGAASGYGACHLSLKHHVKERCTTSRTDSFQLEEDTNPLYDSSGYHASMLFLMGDTYPSHVEAVLRHTIGDDRDGMWSKSDHHHAYIEAQIYGGVDLSKDVDHIVTPKYWNDSDEGRESKAKMQELCKKFGIEHIEKDYPMPN